RKPGRVVVEPHLFPTLDHVAGTATGNAGGRADLLSRHRQAVARLAPHDRHVFLVVARSGGAVAEREDRQQRCNREREQDRSRHGSNPRNSPWWKSTWHSSQVWGIG